MKIGIIGMGTMGKAIHSRLKKDFKLVCFDRKSNLEKLSETNVVIIAVKPQSFASLALNLQKYLSTQTVISVMASISIERMMLLLNSHCSIIRTMPNLGLQYGKSLSAVYSRNGLPRDAKRVISSWGEVVYLKNEKQFDAFTALCGSGPAYFLTLALELERISNNSGFDQKTSRKIAENTLNCANLLTQSGKSDLKGYLDSIKSKGGITSEGLTVLEKEQFNRLLEESIEAAINKSKELSR